MSGGKTGGMEMKINIKKIILGVFITIGMLIVILITWLTFALIPTLYQMRGMYRESKPQSLDKYFETMEDNEGRVLIYKGDWEYDEDEKRYFREIRKKHKKTGIIRTSWESTDRFKSYTREDDYKYDSVVYIGEWEYDEQLKKDIRLIKRQDLRDGQVVETYETKDEKNKDILPKELKLIREIKYSIISDGTTPDFRW